MAKKKKTVKKTTSVDDAGGTVSCFLGLKPSASYSSVDMSIGATVPIQPGEATEDALARVCALVEGTVNEQADSLLDDLWKKVLKFKDDKERSSKRRT